MNGAEQKATAAGGISTMGGLIAFANELANVWVMLSAIGGIFSLGIAVWIHVRNHKLKSRELALKEKANGNAS